MALPWTGVFRFWDWADVPPFAYPRFFMSLKHHRPKMGYESFPKIP
jgi:hypothetical protein